MEVTTILAIVIYLIGLFWVKQAVKSRKDISAFYKSLVGIVALSIGTYLYITNLSILAVALIVIGIVLMLKQVKMREELNPHQRIGGNPLLMIIGATFIAAAIATYLVSIAILLQIALVFALIGGGIYFIITGLYEKDYALALFGALVFSAVCLILVLM